jgi:hypothetical protein
VIGLSGCDRAKREVAQIKPVLTDHDHAGNSPGSMGDQEKSSCQALNSGDHTYASASVQLVTFDHDFKLFTGLDLLALQLSCQPGKTVADFRFHGDLKRRPRANGPKPSWELGGSGAGTHKIV